MAEEDETPPDPETTCSLCFAEFLDPEDLTVHFNQVHLTENSVKCQFCTSKFPSADDYALHIRNVHVLSFKACKYCTKIFTDFDSCRAHQRKHVIPERRSLYKCSQCRNQFANVFSLQQHELTKHDNEQDGVLINKCISILSSYLNIKALNFIQSLGQDAAYICSACSFTSQVPDEYINHLKEKNCRSKVCDSCCNVYKDRKGLYKHLEAHRECHNVVSKEDRKKTCQKCEKSINVHTYQDHVKNCNPIKCNLCNIILDTMDEMTQHQSTAHPMAITMTICKFCHKEFVGNVALKKHIDKKHKPEFHLYKYSCVYCTDMYFKHPQKLFAHFFSKHIDLQPFSCKICNLNFRVRKKFTIHIKLTHNSVGFVEFTDSYHVYFTDKKSENPFQPKSLFVDEVRDENETEVEQTVIMAETEAPTDCQTDAPTDCPTDVPTDTEENKKVGRKPPKIRFKEEVKSKELRQSFKTEVFSEGNQTEVEEKPKIKQKKIKRRKRAVDTAESDSEDEPLIKIKRKSDKKRSASRWNMKQKDTKSKLKKQFTCNICKKYCYTFQNYNHHMSFHFKDEIKNCIKCSKQFSSKTALNKHIAETHTTSRLTETLKNLLERRKMGKNGTAPELSLTDRFRRTIKKVKTNCTTEPAKISEVGDKLKTFIESFSPEETAKKEKAQIQSSVTVKTVSSRFSKPSSIKMTKFIPKPLPTTVKLAMPVRFKPIPLIDKPKLRVKMVQNVYIDEEFGQDDHYDYEEETHTKNDIPEVAEEVMLETHEPQEKKPVVPHKIVLPKLPKNYTNKDIKIAHLLPEAPYYKIVKMEDVLEKPENVIKTQVKDEDDENIRLPGGTKLVNVNPLAHLIGNTPVENLIGPAYKYSKKPKSENFEKAVAKALLKLENARTNNRKRSSKKKTQEKPEPNDNNVDTAPTESEGPGLSLMEIE